MKIITFYFDKDRKVSITTNKTDKEIREIFDNHNWLYNVDLENNTMSCINLKEVKYAEVNLFKSEVK